MKKSVVAIAMLTLLYSLTAQERVTLQQCHDAAAAASPLAGESELHAALLLLHHRNLSTTWLPALDLTGSFNYQSEVVDMSPLLGSLPLPPGAVPTIPHEQYRATIDLSQVIWDGGATRSAREVERMVSELNMQQSEADIYRLREQVNNYYFSLLLVRSQSELTAVLISELSARISEAASGVANGVITSATLDALRAGMIKAEQAADELSRRHQALSVALEQITGMSGLKDAVLLLPETTLTSGDTTYVNLSSNPDLRLFDTRRRHLELSKDLLRSRRMPRLFGYAQAGYGNPPGNNFLSDKADLFYSLGAGVKWNIWDWSHSSNDIRSVTLQQQLLDVRKRAATAALQRTLDLKMAEIESLREAAVRDRELTELQARVTAAAASQLRNGTITASQYLTDLGSEQQALIAAAARKIAIARAEAEYLYIIGNDIKR